ncbi:MAG: hypothetical protein KIT72_10665 [Polyangiaceae bacterium]|nr:hypothetical protein [Polyangiaceae bacterium]MCW5790875.1 hypothetical protein [Polyangiaceae bacterium]
MKERKERGLPTLNQARASRHRQLVLGRTKVPATSPQFWLWTVVVFAAFSGIYWWVSESKLASGKSATLAKQRALGQTALAELIPLRDRVEGWTAELAAEPWPGDMAPRVKLTDVQREPGVYLRLRSEHARSRETLRRAAARSLHDGFTACFFEQSRPLVADAPACKEQVDCEPGLICSEWDRCLKPVQPYNLRLTFRAMRVLSNEWSDEVNQVSSDFGLRVYDLDLDRTIRGDVPIAAEVLERARYVTIVLDEDPPGGLPAALEAAPGERQESEEERVQRAAHPARVGVWDLKQRERVVFLRAQASGAFVPVGARVVTDPQNVAAQQRQANSCSLALAVKEHLGRGSAGADVPDAGAPASDAGDGAPDAGAAAKDSTTNGDAGAN